MTRSSNTSGRSGRKRRLLTQAAPAQVSGIGDAVVIKDGDLAFLCRPDGAVPGGGGHGLGLYFHDCRYLSRYELELCGAAPEALAASSADGFRSIFQLTNPELDGLGRQELGITWRHAIDFEDLALRDELAIRNFHTRPHRLTFTLRFDADFADVFVIRSLSDEQPGRRREPEWSARGLSFGYRGADGRDRELVVHFSQPPARRRGGEARFDLALEPGQEHRLVVSLELSETESGRRGRARRASVRARGTVRDAFERSSSEWVEGFAQVRSSSGRLDRVFERSVLDLRALRSSMGGQHYFAAGVPWFVTLFGRDSLVCALQTLAFRPHIAAQTLRLLARFQGREHDAWRDEAPGKILHELRDGELARLGRVPHTPYYGSVDATLLFLIVLDEHARWTGSLSLFEELRGAVDLALGWMASFDGRDGLIDYESDVDSAKGLVNQGWKDAGDSILQRSGEVARPPVALVEVQAYAVAAWRAAARLFQRSGDGARARSLERRARAMRDRLDRDFWLEKRQYFALGLQGPKREPLDVVSSNPGHALWAGALRPGRATAVAQRLMSDGLYSGWGVRTLSAQERAYNPLGYHLGTVWPHDNAFIAAGLKRYAFDDAACRIFSDLVEASTFFEHHRLPELFAGFPREGFGVPVRYPVACHPQAWAAGSVPLMLQALLGLEPDAFERRLTVVRPVLPAFVEHLRLEQLRVGDAEVDLEFSSGSRGAKARVVAVRGELDVVVQDARAPDR